MTGAELIAAFRRDTGDVEVKYSWDDDEILRYLNQGQQEACRRARLLRDSTTAAVCDAAVSAGNPIVTLDSRVRFVRRARLSLQSLPLVRKRVRDMDDEVSGWDADTTQTTPCIYIPDYQTGSLRLYPIPKVSDTLKMTVIRLPMQNIMATGATVDPEIAPHLHEALLHWAKYRAYLKEDEDTKDEELAAKNLAFFEAEFGPKSPAFDELWIGDNYDANEGGLY